MTAKQTFADRLRACMERMNYKQRYVADQVGVSQPAVAKWLAGDTRKVQADVLSDSRTSLTSMPAGFLTVRGSPG